MDFIQITNDPDFAAFAVSCGVSRIMVDLEQHGKQERQGGLGTFISNHVPQDVAIVRQAVPQAALIVRINPLHDASALEIDQALTDGASHLMLPMFRSADTVARFVALAPTTTLPPPPMASEPPMETPKAPGLFLWRNRRLGAAPGPRVRSPTTESAWVGSSKIREEFVIPSWPGFHWVTP